MYLFFYAMIHYRSFFKLIALILVLFILLQSCRIYHKSTATLDQAIDSEQKVKVILVDDSKIYFDQIKIDGDILYGANNIHGQIRNTLLSRDQIKYIYLFDSANSKKRTHILIPVLISGGIILLIGYGIYSFSNTDWLSWD